MRALEQYFVEPVLLVFFFIGAAATTNVTSEVTLTTPEASVLVCVREDPTEQPRIKLQLLLSGYDGVLHYFGGSADLLGEEILSPGAHILTYVHGITDRTHNALVTIDDKDIPFTKPSDRKMWYTSFQFKFVEVFTEGPAAVAVLEEEQPMSPSDLVSMCRLFTNGGTTTGSTTAETEPSSTTPIKYDLLPTEEPVKISPQTSPTTPAPPTPSMSSIPPPPPPTPPTSLSHPEPPATPTQSPHPLPPTSATPKPPKSQESILFGQRWLKMELVVGLGVLAGLVVLCCGFTCIVCVCCKRSKTGSPRSPSKTAKKKKRDAEYQKVPPVAKV